MEKVTAEQCREAVEMAEISKIYHHHCGACGAATSYIFARAREVLDKYEDPEELVIGYDSSCGCCSQDHGPTLSTWDEFAQEFNRQNPEARSGMWNRMLVGGALFV